MIFSVENGTYFYHEGNEILRDISFSVSPGEVLAVLGSNGIGKTTLLKCMMGLLSWRRGRSLVDGQDIRTLPARQLWRSISYVPQAKDSSLTFSALDMTLIGRSPYLDTFAQPGEKDLEIARKALSDVGAGHLAGKLCCEMSGGELQLVLIARALASEPQLLVLDEPESGLDFKNQLIILELIRRLAKDRGISAIINTHYPLHALELADKTLMLYRDCRYAFGRTREIVDAEHMLEAFEVNVHVGTVEVNGKLYDDLIPLSIVEKER